MRTHEIVKRLRSMGEPERAKKVMGFFKTGPGTYGEGDVFVGLAVPALRKLAKEYESLSKFEALLLLRSPVHEARFLALLLLIHNYNKGDAELRERIFEDYLENARFVNNWDLVDVSAEHIVGAHLLNRDRGRLITLAESSMLWERRIAIVATFHFVKRGEFADTLLVAERLLGDSQDLIHKAVGWMLREVGKRDQKAEESFLKAHYMRISRTTLRYSIERFPKGLRLRYLRGEM